jgi:hypothetical protein
MALPIGFPIARAIPSARFKAFAIILWERGAPNIVVLVLLACAYHMALVSKLVHTFLILLPEAGLRDTVPSTTVIRSSNCKIIHFRTPSASFRMCGCASAVGDALELEGRSALLGRCPMAMEVIASIPMERGSAEDCRRKWWWSGTRHHLPNAYSPREISFYGCGQRDIMLGVY